MTGRIVGVIGGSGLYDMEELADRSEHSVQTTFGAPSDVIVGGTIGETRFLFLPRHGRGHRIPPHRINYRANILALKQLGAEQLVSISAVGSLQESVHPGHVVLVDQFIDRTRSRPSTFFEEPSEGEGGMVAHVEFADPVCAALSDALHRAAAAAGNAVVHRGGTYVCIEGPQFSTRAESQLYRSWGASVVGMTNLPEARLAREAELPYATVALVTDFDCWHQTEESVTVDAILAMLKKNVSLAHAILRELASRVPDPAQSPASSALAHALITAPGAIPEKARARLAPLVDKYL